MAKNKGYRTMTIQQWKRIPKWKKWIKGNIKYALIQKRKGTSYQDLIVETKEIKIKK